jgi:hypothetical protein
MQKENNKGDKQQENVIRHGDIFTARVIPNRDDRPTAKQVVAHAHTQKQYTLKNSKRTQHPQHRHENSKHQYSNKSYMLPVKQHSVQITHWQLTS